jgi:hypothetical protein
MNKKSLLWIIGLIAVSFIIIAVANGIISGNLFGKNETFKATVLENKMTSLLVEPLKGEDELSSSDKIVVRINTKDNTLKDLSEFKAGSLVKITYGGAIMESYPAQINAYRIEFAK